MTAREAELIQQLVESQQSLAAALRENQLLRQKVDLLVRRVFGSSSEKLDVAQLRLLQLSEAPPAAEPPPVVPSRAPRTPRSLQPKPPRLPDNLRLLRKSLIPNR
jgi:hypothetical protein